MTVQLGGDVMLTMHERRPTPIGRWLDSGAMVPAAAVALVAWSILVSGGNPATWLPVLAGWLVLAGAYLLGRLLVVDLVPVALTLAGALLVYLVAATFSGHAIYPNSAAALAVQVLALCLLAYQSDRQHPWWSGAVWMAAALALVPVLQGSVAALAGVFLVGAAFLAASAAPGRRTTIVAAGTGLTLVTVCAVVQVLLARGVAADGFVQAALSDRRLQLWGDAMALGTAAPWTGQGLGSFAAQSAVAHDPDTTRAHSLLLQTFAEVGLVGVAIVACLVVGVLATIVRNGAPNLAPVAAAAWSALCLQALVDYVADSPMVLAAAGLVVGVAVAARAPADVPADAPVQDRRLSLRR